MKMASPIKESFDENDHVDVGIKTQGILKTDEDFIPQGDSRIEDGIGQLPLDNAKTTDNMEPENQGELESGGENNEVIGRVVNSRRGTRKESINPLSKPTHDSSTDPDSVMEFESDSDGRLVRYNRQFRTPHQGMLPLRRRIREAPKQVEKVVQHTKLVEDRLVTLERKVKRLKRQNKNYPTVQTRRSTHAPGTDIVSAHLPQTSRKTTKIHGRTGSRSKLSTDASSGYPTDDDIVNSAEYDKWVKVKRITLKDFHKPEHSLGHAIDVAMGTENQLRNTTIVTHYRQGIETSIAPSWSPGDSAAGMLAEIPIRLRINSKILIEELEKVIDQSIKRHSTILRPFKVLLTHEDKIRRRMAELEEEIKHFSLDNDKKYKKQSDSTLPKDVAGSASYQPREIHSSTGAVDTKSGSDIMDAEQVCRLADAWRCLIEVLDVDLRDIRASKEEIREGTKSTITFSGVWQLYEPGDLVFKRRKGELRAMRVLDVTGGRSIITAEHLQPQPSPPPFPFPFPPPPPRLRPRHRPRDVVQRPEIELEPDYQVTQPVNDLHLTLYYIAFNGTDFGVIQEETQISVFDGERDIASLDIVPEQYLERLDETKQTLKERGIKYRDLLSKEIGAHRHYSGLTWDSPQEEVDSSIVVDWASAILHKPEWERPLGIKTRHFPDNREIRETSFVNCERDPGRCYTCDTMLMIFRDIFNDHIFERKLTRQAIQNQRIFRTETFRGDEIQEDDLILLDFVVFGWILKDRRWAKFDIDLIRKIPLNRDGFKSLSLPEGYQEIVESLVTTHFKKQTEEKTESINVDLVQGKGKGLIILLHGAPGVGKTSTAECVAEYTGRPLYPITCGDIGETAREVEKNLQETFLLAHKWGCVLLLDEADVFLAKRDKSDVKRNALVSVFLRVLEYYAGILFLTTNRVGTMDEAFRSRIHMSLHYPPLSAQFTQEVWKTNLRRMKDGPPAVREMVYDRDEILRFAKKHFKESKEKWNGRQIRNAFQTAIALALWDKAKESNSESNSGASAKQKPAVLTRRHFKRVAETSQAFNDYMKEVNEKGAADQASEDMWRANPVGEFENTDKPKKPKKISRREVSDSDSDSGSEESSDQDWGDSDSDSNRKAKNRKSPKGKRVR